jgi:hypothetical protein
MTSCWQKVIVAASLHKIGGCFAIDLKIESQIPPKVWGPQNDKAPAGVRGGGSNRGYANENKNEEECAGGGVS